MSGIEIAGLVLASLPLTISALEHYRDVEEVVEGWWKVKAEYKKCMRNLNFCKVAFEENLEELLLPLLVDEENIERLLAVPGGPDWKEPELEQMLLERLPKTYSSYVETIETMMEIMGRLNESLGMNKTNFQARIVGEVQTEKSASTARKTIEQVSASVEFHSQRIRLAFNKGPRQKLFDDFINQNTRLRSILGSSDRLTALRKSRTMAKTLTGLLKFWHHGNRLFQLLTQAWSCQCKGLHRANLLLQDRKTPTVDFRIVFWFTHLASLGDPNSPQSSWNWQETRIKLMETPNSEVHAPIETKIEHHTSSMSTSTSSFNFISSSKTSITLLAPNVKKAPENKPKSSLKKKLWPPQSHLSEKHYGWSNFPQQNANTTAVEKPPQVEPVSVITTHVSRSRVAFTSEENSIEKKCKSTRKITNLCTRIANCSSDLPDYGCLESDVCQYVVQPLCEPKRKAQNHISLETLLSKASPIVLTRRQRYHTAVIVASSHIQLHPTPWLKSKWRKRDILFCYDLDEPTKLCMDQPYISQSVSRPTGPLSTATTGMAFSFQDSLRNLGILLLELCFGYAIEDHRLRQNFQTSDEQSLQLINYAVATEWSRTVVDEAGLEFADAITWCLHHIPVIGNSRGHGIEDDNRWRQDMFANVVEPISYCHDQLKSLNL